MTNRLTIPQGSSNKPSPSAMSAMKRVTAVIHSSLPISSTNSSNTAYPPSVNDGSQHSYSSPHPTQFLSRLTDIQQMDIQSALDQMQCLVTHNAPKVYKLAYYRKQTKGHWARDDPGFVVLQVVLLLLACLAHGIAFKSDSIVSNTILFAFHSIGVNYLGIGALLATLGRHLANTYLQAPTSSQTHVVSQRVEWMYAFDIHCNAYVPLFGLLYGIQFFLLPLVLQNTLLAFLISNTLYTIGFGYYFYVTHLGYRGECKES